MARSDIPGTKKKEVIIYEAEVCMMGGLGRQACHYVLQRAEAKVHRWQALPSLVLGGQHAWTVSEVRVLGFQMTNLFPSNLHITLRGPRNFGESFDALSGT